MRARFTPLRALAPALTSLLLGAGLVGACVPDFSFGGGGSAPTTSGGDGGAGQGGRRGDGGDSSGSDGGRQNPTGKASASASSGAGDATSSIGPSSSSGHDTGATASVAASSDASASASASSGEPPPTESTPCFQGDQGIAVECSGAQGTCCIDWNAYAEDGCVAAGACNDNGAWPAECNEPSDCPGQLCCMNLDILLDFHSYTCESSCFDSEACDPLAPEDTCQFGSCRRRFQQDEDHPEYDHYGFCD